MNRHAACLAAAAMIVATLAPPSFAQRKPDAPPLQPDEVANAPDMALFEEAYERAGEPTFLVICGIENKPLQVAVEGRFETGAEQQAATGTIAGNRHIGAGIALFDPAGDSVKLKADIEETLLQNAVIDLVSLDALAERDRREVQLLQARNEKRAVNLLASKLNAEIVLLVRMLNTQLVRERGAIYRVTVEILDVPRGRKIGGFAFDWKGGVDSVAIKKYALQITRKAISQFAAWYARGDSQGAARRYTVRMVGLSNVGQLVKAQRAFENIQGVTGIKTDGFSSDKKTSVGTLTLRYTGRPIELLYELQETAGKELGMKVDGTDGASGTVTLIAKGGRGNDSRWEAIADPDDADHEAAKKEVAKQYTGEGRPKIGIVITRLLSETQLSDPKLAKELQELGPPDGPANAGASQIGAVVNINLGPTGDDDGDDYLTERLRTRDRRAELMDTRKMEDAMYKHMLKLGFIMVDPVQARQRLSSRMEKSRTLYREDELVFLLGQSAGIDILIQGVGQGGHTTGGDISYTFRAVRVSDGVTLAAEGWPTGTEEEPEEETVEGIAAFAVGRLVEQMLDAWSPANTLTVMTTNAKTQREVFAVMNVFKENVPGVVGVDFDEHDSDREGGLGVFTLRYTTSYDDLVGRIASLEGKLPFDLGVGGTTRDTLTVKIKDGL